MTSSMPSVATTPLTALAFDHQGDCGIYNLATLERARRRGLGTALTALHVHDALARGCQTASLQSTKVAERAYAAGDRNVIVHGAYTAQRALEAGVLDELEIHQTPQATHIHNRVRR